MEPDYVFDVTDAPLEAADPTMSSHHDDAKRSLWGRSEFAPSPSAPGEQLTRADGESGIVTRLRAVSRGPLDRVTVATWVAVLVVVVAFWGGMAAIVVGAIGSH